MNPGRVPRIGLALGAGGARGWSHIGVLRALEAEGVRPNVVCGTSIGALVGAAYASGDLDRLETWVRGLNWTDVLSLVDPTWRGGFIKGVKLIDFFRRHFEDREIGALGVRYGAVATDLSSGREVTLAEGSVLEAVRASIALPGIFTPVARDGQLLVDGGLVNPVPVSLCRALGAEVVIAVDLGWAKLGRHRASAEAAMPSVLEVFVTSMDIMQVRAARSRLAGEPADALVTPLLPGFGTMEFHRAREAIDEGRAAVQRMLPLIRQVLED